MNPYEFGVDTEDYHIVQHDIHVPDNMIKNPFFVNSYRQYNDINKNDIKNCNRIVILCLKDGCQNISMQLYDYAIVPETFFKYCNENLTCIIGNKNLLGNKLFRNIITIVDGEHLNKISNQLFYPVEIVLPLFEVEYKYINEYIESFNKNIDIINELNKCLVMQYYDKQSENKIVNVLDKINRNQFWSDEKNCNISITEQFNKRNFRLINNIVRPSSYIIHDEGYKFMDIASAIKGAKDRKYFISNNNFIEESNCINKIFKNVDNPTNLYNIFNTLAVSKDYCHIVVNNKQILTKMKEIFENYYMVYKYVLGYPWLTFYIEECLKRNFIESTDRFLFTIDTANLLPTFPFSYDDISQNPYISFVVKQNDYTMDNIFSDYYSCYDKGGICTLDEFQQRFNIFLSYNAHINILKDIDWESFAISGSVIPACSQKNPLLFVDSWANFFEKYYKDSDIDIMCNKKSIIDFCLTTHQLTDHLKTKVDGLNVIFEKATCISVNPKYISYIKNDINTFLDSNMNEDEIINHIKNSNDDIKLYFYGKYIEHKNRFNKIIKTKNNNDDYVKQLMKPTSFDNMYTKLINYDSYEDTVKFEDTDMFYLFHNDIDENKVLPKKNLLMIKFSESIKFNISSSTNSFRKLQVWRIQQHSFASCVSRFHLPCVRGFYQKDNVYLLPSCITALMTNINIDYKYFSCRKDPFDIFTKYKSRGFAILLNNSELEEIKAKFGNDTIKKDVENCENIHSKHDILKFYDDNVLFFEKLISISHEGKIVPYNNSIVQALYSISSFLS